MIIDNEKIFQTEELDKVQEIYDKQINNFSEHINTYLNNKDKVDTYKGFMIELWGQDDWLNTYYAIYNDIEKFKKDYINELEEFYE